MNKFMIPPDSLAPLAGCVFWLGAFALGAALVWVTLLKLAGAVL